MVREAQRGGLGDGERSWQTQVSGMGDGSRPRIGFYTRVYGRNGLCAEGMKIRFKKFYGKCNRKATEIRAWKECFCTSV